MIAHLLSRVLLQPTPPTDLSTSEWESLLGQARRSRLLPRLAHHFRRAGRLGAVPQRPRQHLEGAIRLADRQRREVLWELGHLQDALCSLGVPVVLLKGAAYVAASLPPAPGRLFSDIDILVPEGRLADVELALFRSGWIGVHRDAYTQQYYRRWSHELPPLRHVRRGTNLDVHRAITSPTSRFAVPGEKLIASAQPLPSHPGLWILSPADMVLHSAAHLFQEGEFDHGLRDLLDMNDLLRHFGLRSSTNWAELLMRAADLGLEVPLRHALTQLQQLDAGAVPRYTLEALAARRRHPSLHRLTNGLLTTALRPNHPSCARAGDGLVRWLLYVRSHWLRMPPHLLAYHLGRKAITRSHRSPG